VRGNEKERARSRLWRDAPNKKKGGETPPLQKTLTKNVAKTISLPRWEGIKGRVIKFSITLSPASGGIFNLTLSH